MIVHAAGQDFAAWFVFRVVHLSAGCLLCLAEAIFAVIDFFLCGVFLRWRSRVFSSLQQEFKFFQHIFLKLDFSLVLWLESEHSFTARKHAFGNRFRD
jgi:hypothetical protein